MSRLRKTTIWQQPRRRRWRASEAQSGDGGKTAILAFNLAIARLSLDHDAAAVEPARRAVALAQKGAAGVDPLAARLILGHALVAANYAEAKVLLPPALVEARAANADVRAAAYDAASAFAKTAGDRKDWTASAEAYGSAFDYAEWSAGDVEMNRGTALIGRGVAFAAQHKDPQAFEALAQAVNRLAPLAPERADDETTAGELYYANALAWWSAISSRMSSEKQVRDSTSVRARRPLLNKGPLCTLSWSIDPPIRYPAGQANTYGVGGAVIKISVDAAGNVVGHRVLAAVPTKEFGAALENPRAKWTVKPAKNAPLGCRLESKGHLVQVHYSF
jgi:hypothetical protein